MEDRKCGSILEPDEVSLRVEKIRRPSAVSEPLAPFSCNILPSLAATDMIFAALWMTEKALYFVG